MKRVWQPGAKLLAGLVITAMYAMPQAYTISARPGALNYIEGNAYINGRPMSDKGLRSVFLNANDTLSTDIGKAEVLLTPGVFLRIGDNSAVKMISPSLIDTQVEVTRGEAMVEAAGLMKDNNIQILDHNGTIRISKDGLYRFTADDPPSAAVIEGKAEVSFADEKIELGKGHETVIGARLKAEKFDTKKPDELYAWSNVRSEYDAASSYQTAKNVPLNNSGGWWGYGFGDWYNPGWYWNNGFDSWAWLPAYGSFYSPFGYGFYAPGLIGYAPVIYAPVYGGGGTYWKNHPKPGTPVPVNPKNPPATGAIRSGSPAEYAQARSVMAHSFANTGFTSANGSHIAAGGHSFFGGAGASHVGGGAAARSSGGFSGGGHAAGGFGGGGGHAGGGGGGGGHR
jgi:hypothetical protein